MNIQFLELLGYIGKETHFDCCIFYTFSIQNVFGERTRRVAFLNFFYCSQDFYGKNLYKQNEYKNNHKFNLND